MQDLTVPADGGTTAAPDARRAAANQALADAVLEWLRANHQIPEDREVAAVDFAVTFTAKWLTPTGRVGRHTGTIIPPDGPDLRSLGDMMLRRSQKVRDPLYEIDRLDIEYRPADPITRHRYLPGCVVDHSMPPRPSPDRSCRPGGVPASGGISSMACRSLSNRAILSRWMTRAAGQCAA